MKKYVLFAGVNGSGKSTLYNMGGEYMELPRVNTDEILAEFGDWKKAEDVLKAGKIAVNRIKEMFSNEQSFVQETTLCGHSVMRNILLAKENGYKVIMFYIGVETVDIAKERIANRVKNGGHGIPDADVERRFLESFENLKKVMPVCDEIYFYDNTDEFRRIAAITNGIEEIKSTNLPTWFIKFYNE